MPAPPASAKSAASVGVQLFRIRQCPASPGLDVDVDVECDLDDGVWCIGHKAPGSTSGQVQSSSVEAVPKALSVDGATIPASCNSSQNATIVERRFRIAVMLS